MASEVPWCVPSWSIGSAGDTDKQSYQFLWSSSSRSEWTLKKVSVISQPVSNMAILTRALGRLSLLPKDSRNLLAWPNFVSQAALFFGFYHVI
jgi:hypothetical protein